MSPGRQEVNMAAFEEKGTGPRPEGISPRKGSLSRGLVTTMLVYFAIQWAIFCAYALPFRFIKAFALPFALSSAGFLGLILGLLFVFKDDFVLESSGRRLDRVNLANKITLFRVTTLPTILIVIIASKTYPIRYSLIALVAIVFATDFLDGYVSRRFNEATRVGRMLDSASDYALLFVITVVYYYFRIIPAWFLVLLVARLAGQACMLLIVLAVKKRVTLKTSFLGKATVASSMVLYAFELLRFVTVIPMAAYRALEYAVGGIIVLSIVDKIAIMARDLKAPAFAAAEAGRLNSTSNGESHAD